MVEAISYHSRRFLKFSKPQRWHYQLGNLIHTLDQTASTVRFRIFQGVYCLGRAFGISSCHFVRRKFWRRSSYSIQNKNVKNSLKILDSSFDLIWIHFLIKHTSTILIIPKTVRTPKFRHTSAVFILRIYQTTTTNSLVTKFSMPTIIV